MVKEALKFYLKNNLFCIISLIFLITYWLSARELPDESWPFPRLIITYVFIPLILWNIVASIVELKNNLKKRFKTQEIKDNHDKSGLDRKEIQKIIGLSITLVYVILISRLGFYISTTLYLLSFNYLLEIRSIYKTILYVLLINGSIYILFERWLGIAIPSGILF